MLSEEVGLPTLRDIVEELKKPGRDPRAQFQAAAFRDDVKEIGDLHEGMILQGVVTNVTAFGAFVDIGVHQDGLVHVSHLASRFVRDPNEAVKVGEIVKVKVLSADVAAQAHRPFDPRSAAGGRKRDSAAAGGSQRDKTRCSRG